MSTHEKAFRVKRRRRRRRRGRGLNRKQVAMVKSVVNKKLASEIELKHYDQIVNTSNDFAFTNSLSLFDPTQGVGDTQRVGDVVNLKSIFLRFVLSGVDATNIQRLQVIQWMEDTTVATPNMSITLQHTSGATVAPEILSPLQIDKKYRYKVLWDKSFSHVFDSETRQQIYEVFISKGFARKVEFTNASTSGLNKIYLLFISDSQAVAHPTIEGYSRIRYSDA